MKKEAKPTVEITAEDFLVALQCAFGSGYAERMRTCATLLPGGIIRLCIGDPAGGDETRLEIVIPERVAVTLAG